MTREGVENIKDALKVISEQCKAANWCDNCPLIDCCEREVGVFKIRPEYWFTRILSIRQYDVLIEDNLVYKRELGGYRK